MKRKHVAFFCCICMLFFVLLLPFFYPFSPQLGAQKTVNSPQKSTVVLDAGHGGIDSGVVGKSTGVKESDLNLAVVRALGRELSAAGFRVLYTRVDEGGLYGQATAGFKKRDMYRRREIIQAANAFAVISVHMNSYPLSPSRRGAQTFFLAKSDASRALATHLQRALNALNSRAYSPLAGEYFMLACSSAPSVIVECGFLSNGEEEALLQTPEYQNLLAKTVAQGLALYCAEL